MYHVDGCIYTYENTSRQYTLEEAVKFDLSGCVIDGTRNSGVKISVRPGHSKHIDIVKTGQGRFSAKLVDCNFNVERAY